MDMNDELLQNMVAWEHKLESEKYFNPSMSHKTSYSLDTRPIVRSQVGVR